MRKPLAIDLFCGLGGWTEGLLAEGWDVIGFDIERHAYGEHRYPARLVLQDVRTIHGSQFKHASLIVASSPCQEFSYRAMPWKRAKALGPPELGMELFAQAERIQREAIEAAGHFIPMVQENVRGAQKYVGRARWHYGSFYLWGDVPALMPMTQKATKVSMPSWRHPTDPRHVPGLGFNTMADRQTREADDSVKCGGSRGDDWFAHHNRDEFMDRVTKNGGGSWFNIAHNTASGHGQNPVNAAHENGVKGFTPHGQPLGKNELGRKHGSKSSARKAASARIAKIPTPLARHIARTYYPTGGL
jgi:hypothetical protein